MEEKPKEYVYCIYNPFFKSSKNPNNCISKIGLTTVDPFSRAKQLARTTGVPGFFKVRGYIECTNCKYFEDIMHYRFDDVNIHSETAQEWFDVSPDEVMEAFTEIPQSLIDKEPGLFNIIDCEETELERNVNNEQRHKVIKDYSMVGLKAGDKLIIRYNGNEYNCYVSNNTRKVVPEGKDDVEDNRTTARNLLLNYEPNIRGYSVHQYTFYNDKNIYQLRDEKGL